MGSTVEILPPTFKKLLYFNVLGQGQAADANQTVL